MRQLAFALAPPPPPTLENFVAGRNGELLAVLRAAAEGGTERFVCLWGGRGCGKSHLLAAAAAIARVGLLLDASTDPELARSAVDTPFDLLLVDNVQCLGADGQARLFRLYNAARDRGAGLIASADAPPSRLALRDDLVTRLGWGLVYQLHALSDQEKAAALGAHAQERGFKLPAEVADYLLVRESRELPHLIALLDALDRLSLETKRPVTVPLARELLAAVAQRQPRPSSRSES